ncbi:hypothetical protein M434DRAFT_397116 [Hypoxylon sp. CO27-5]|nr:hypothetical protein M434DRAFT_397116 [Hypoxylon sp. CO27-5]
MALTERDDISIVQIIVYVPTLFLALWLAIRHGFGRNAGWYYLIVFSLARIVGASLQLATISDPTNISLHVGAVTVQTIGLSPLIMVQIALIGRALGSIRKETTSFVTEKRLRLVQVIAVVGLILGIVGGTQSGQDYSKTGKYTISDLSKAGMGLTIAAYVLLVLTTVIVATQQAHIEPGEKRLLLAVSISLPFILVRLIYSVESVFGNNPSFSQLTGDVNIQLGMSVIMEMIVVFIVEGIGMTLKKLPKDKAPPANSSPQQAGYQQSWQQVDSDHEMGGYNRYK